MKRRKKIKAIEDLVPDTGNANRGTERGRGMLEESLRTLGAGRSILVDKHGRVIAGNKTLEVAAELGPEVETVQTDGHKLIVVQRTDLDLDVGSQARELAYADNRIAQVNLDWDVARMAADIEAGVDLGRWWVEDELKALEVMEKPEPPEDHGPHLNKADELREKWNTALGQVWEIPSATGDGVHRLMCGDCKTERPWKAVASMIVTDPPYGVAYTGKTKDALTIENDDCDEKTLTDLVERWFCWCEWVSRPGAYWFATVPSGPLHLIFAADWKRRGILRQIMVWGKDQFVMGHSEYHYQHEPILFGWVVGKRLLNPDRTRSTLWMIDRPRASREHPTMKPVELFARAIRNHTKSGGVICDPFLGSGTTMVAAEQLGRVCYGMEIAPKYVAVALQRMADMGLVPTKNVDHNGR